MNWGTINIVLQKNNIQRATWTEIVSKEEILWKIRTKRTLLLKVRKKHLTFFRDISRKVRIENLALTRYCEGKRRSENIE